MQQFIIGFLIALCGSALAVFLFLRKKSQKSANNTSQVEELSKLAGGLAHEIKNPLSTIKVNLKLTSEDLEHINSVQQSDQYLVRAIKKLSIIQKETDRLEQILEGFLRFTDRTSLKLADIDVNSVLGDMVDFFLPQAQSHSITIRQGFANTPLICKIDEYMLKQALLNLFINAQQAMATGGELILRTAKARNFAVIQISDTGCGIKPENLPKIFDAYYSSRPQGSGLGLPTAKKIIQAHNGSIEVNSEIGKGTSFTIKLPLSSEYKG